MSRSPAHGLSNSLRTAAPLLPLLLLLTACAASNPSSSLPDPPAALTPAIDLAPGTRVLVERSGQWLPATVVGRYSADRVTIHYEGSDPTWDEPVGLDRVRPLPAAVSSDYRVGEKALATAQGRLLLAEIIQQVGPDEWRIHYDGYGPEVAENVKPDRLRRPFAGVTLHSPGEAVAIDVGGRTAGASVLAALAADRWLVRFEGFGPEYDQEVTADRFRPRAPAATAAAAPPALPAPAPAIPATPGKGGAAGSFQVNEDVLVAHRGVYHLAAVIGAGAGDHRWRVRYKTSAVGNEGSVSGSDEDVAGDRLSRFVNPDKGSRMEPKQNVFVEYHGVFFPGRITRIPEKGQYQIRYENFGPEADEVIPARRLHPRP